ncbi:MAG: type III polyketide synthase [Caldilineaceae bacterium]|nr:type III polyketide synthase [Caldilineaceae bacterium]
MFHRETPEAAILAIGTAVPPYKARQSDVGEWMSASFVDAPVPARLIRMLCANSGVETRYSCVEDYFLPPQESRFAPGVPTERSPSTAERMAIYERESIPLGADAARQAISTYAAKRGDTYSLIAGQITHLVVATCTGFFAPGLDFALAHSLHLSPTVERTLIGFMGCSAMFNCLRTANQIVKADPNALVLVVSVELCSLHSQPEPLRDQLVGASFFADGASACLVGTPNALPGDYFTLLDFHTSMKPDTESEMVWQIGNYGFALRLSPRIPEHLADAAPATLATLFPDSAPDFWAIHPGGSAIIDRLAKSFGLDESQVAASRAVLRDYGNLSSATILFVLAELRRSLLAERQPAPDLTTDRATRGDNLSGVAMAFGPGLVIEMARIAYAVPDTPISSASTIAATAALALP